MPTRRQLEVLLEADPDDVFLHYALALATIAEGGLDEGLARLDDVISRDADYVAAYFQKAQRLAEHGEAAAARESLEQGIAAARRTGDAHAEREMTDFLEML